MPTLAASYIIRGVDTMRHHKQFVVEPIHRAPDRHPQRDFCVADILGVASQERQLPPVRRRAWRPAANGRMTAERAVTPVRRGR